MPSYQPFWEPLITAGGYAATAAGTVSMAAARYSPLTMERWLDKVQAAAGQAGRLQKTYAGELFSAFITPLEREDLWACMKAAAAIPAAAEELLLLWQAARPSRLPPDILPWAALFAQGGRWVQGLMEQLPRFSREEFPGPYGGRLLRLPAQSRRFYQQALTALYRTETNPKLLCLWHHGFEKLHRCCLLCSEAGETVLQAILKNL